MGESGGDGEGAADAGAGDEAEDFLVAGGVGGREVGAFEAERDGDLGEGMGVLLLVGLVGFWGG